MRVAGTAADLPATVARLEAEVAALRTALATLTTERDQYRPLYAQLREAYTKLAAGLRGPAAERLPPDERQLTLARLGTLLGGDPTASSSRSEPTPGGHRRGGGRCPITCGA